MSVPVWLILVILALAVVLLSAWALVAINLPDDDWQAEPVWSQSGATLEPLVTHDAAGLTVTEWHREQRETAAAPTREAA